MAGRLEARAALLGPRELHHGGTRVDRASWWALAALGAGVLVTARMLTPDPSGHGTHMQLGLPPCGFLWLTSLPCPACGLTTAFAYMARFEVTSAVLTHPMGVPLFALTALGVPLALWAGVRGWPVSETLDRLQVQRVALALAGGTLLTWVARVSGILLD